MPTAQLISAIIRHGEIVMSYRLTVLDEGDEVLALVDDSSREQLATLLGRR
jgi:hypothetical protein